MAVAERIPPHSEEAERSVLGSILIDKEAFFKVSEFIVPEDFYQGSHKEIFTAMVDLYRDDSPIDIVTVSEALQKRKSLEAVGGRTYIAELAEFVPTTSNVVSYAKIVQEKAVYRKLVSAGSDIVENAMGEKFEAAKVLDEAESTIFDIAKTRQKKDYVKIQTILDKNLEEIEDAQKHPGQLSGISTGFIDLDNATLGLQKSDLIIIAARPSMGKTAFALNIALNAAFKDKKRVAFFSVEMSGDALGFRFLAMQARVDGKKLKSGTLSDEELVAVTRAISEFKGTDILIDEAPGISVMEVRNKCRRMNAEKKLDLILIDYLQIMGSDSSSDNRVNEVSLMTRQLKQLAREMECPVVVLSQLSRSAVQRKDGGNIPRLEDLRDSGSIEQDADVVMFIHREDYYKKKEDPKDGITKIIIAKQRQGETGSIELTWVPKYQRFTNIAHENTNPEGAQ